MFMDFAGPAKTNNGLMDHPKSPESKAIFFFQTGRLYVLYFLIWWIGDTSSNGWFSIVILDFRGCTKGQKTG